MAKPLLSALAAKGYESPTKIQAAAIPPALAGRDVLGCAQTGTGKTAAFALPILQRLSQAAAPGEPKHRVHCLVLAPTRELASQICESFQTYGRHSRLRAAAIFGGVSQVPQVRALRSGADVLIATPGRLLDLMQQRHVDLAHVQVLVLDEADRMLDMGFIHDLRRIVAKVPRQRQTLLFSATMPESIRELARAWQHDPVDLRVTPVSSTAERIRQSVYFVDRAAKTQLLVAWLRETSWDRALVFTRTKRGADKLAKQLSKAGIKADAMHGDKSQNARQLALARFRSPNPAVLVATDVAARGLDVEKISHVINFDMPQDPEDYVHRIGRTGRAGAEGIAVSFCADDDRKVLKSIQRLTRQELAVESHPAAEDRSPPAPAHRFEQRRPAAARGRRFHGKKSRFKGRNRRKPQAAAAR